MVFSYFRRLSRAHQRIYLASDQITSLSLPGQQAWNEPVLEIARALAREDRLNTEQACQRLVSALTAAFRISPARVRVLSKRPANHRGELHGLYQPAEQGVPASITVWMRTARRRQVVAFRTFLRTLVHELCHHLDLELLRLGETFHTEGFYKRESSLVHQLLGPAGAQPPLATIGWRQAAGPHAAGWKERHR